MKAKTGAEPGKAVTKGTAALSAFVLHSHAWSESSLILQLFTREQGRLVVVAKGAKRPYSQLRPVLLPFQRLQVQLGRPKTASSDRNSESDSEVLNLRAAEWDGSGTALVFAPVTSVGIDVPNEMGSPTTSSADAKPLASPRLSAVRPVGLVGDALLSGFYLNELLLRLLPRQDAHPLLFDAYAHTVAVLAWAGRRGVEGGATSKAEASAAALRAFELIALREAGLLPELGLHAVRQTPLLPEANYALRPEWGVVEADSAATSPGAMPPGSAPRHFLRGSHLDALQSALEAGSFGALMQSCAQDLPALKAALRHWLDYHLSQLGSPPLRSRQIAREAHSYKAE